MNLKKEYTYSEKRVYHNNRKKQLERRLASLNTKELNQLADSIGFLVGADYESTKTDDFFSASVKRGQNAYKYSKGGKA